MNKVDFFFQMLRGIYGASKVSTTWPTDLDMQLAKKLWQAEIERHSEAELRAAIDHAKRMIGNCEDEWMWPNIGVILTDGRDCFHRKVCSKKPLQNGRRNSRMNRRANFINRFLKPIKRL